MNLTNYHSHCSFCDGRAPLEDFIKEAISQKFTSYGISSHAPLSFSTHWAMKDEDLPAYLEECFRLRDQYKDQIELYIGLEIDYLNDDSNPSIDKFTQLPLDYRIGAVHLLYNKKGEVIDVDCSLEKYIRIVDEHFGGDIEYIVKLYYDRLLRMIELGGFDIIAHADKIHYNASQYYPGLLDEPWYDSLMQDYFKAIANSGYMVEINTKAYLQMDVFFPNERYFPLLKELNIPILVNSDAHFPKRINSGRPEALAKLKESGFTHVMELHQGKWQKVPIA